MMNYKIRFSNYLAYIFVISTLLITLLYSCKKEEEIPEPLPPPCDECKAFTGKFDLVAVIDIHWYTGESIWVTLPHSYYGGRLKSAYMKFQQDYKVIIHEEGTSFNYSQWTSEDYVTNTTYTYKFINDSMIGIGKYSTEATFYPYPISEGSTVDSIIHFGARLYHRSYSYQPGVIESKCH